MDKLQEATFAMNISFNRALGTSPFVFKNGHQPIIALDKELNIKIKRPPTELIDGRDARFQKYAENNISKGKISCFNDYKLGDEVLVFKENLPDKFESKWKIGFKILKKVGEDGYIVNNGISTLRVNRKHLRLANRGKEEGGMSQ